MAGRPLKFATPEVLQAKIDEYFRSCFDYKRDMFGNRIIDKDLLKEDPESKGYILQQVKPFTVTGLAVALDTSRDVLMDYEKNYGDEFSDTIKRAKQRIYEYAENSLFIGKSPSGAIFNLKNNWGWVDKQEIDNTHSLKSMPTIKKDGKEIKFDIGDPEITGPSSEASEDS
jgi:hypothetical protein